MGGAIAGVYDGGKGTVRGPKDKVRGLRNHRSRNSPKALQAMEMKRLKREKALQRGY